MKRGCRHLIIACLLTSGCWIHGSTQAREAVVPSALSRLDSLSLAYSEDLYRDPSLSDSLSALLPELRRIFARSARTEEPEDAWRTALAILSRMPGKTAGLKEGSDYLVTQLGKVDPALAGLAQLAIWHLWHEKGLLSETAYRHRLHTALTEEGSKRAFRIPRTSVYQALAESFRFSRPDSAHRYAAEGWQLMREADARPTDSALYYLLQQIETPFFSVSGLQVYAPGRPMLWSVCAKNMHRLSYEIFHVPAAERMNLLSGMMPLDRYVVGKEAVSQGVWSLEDFPQDYREHRAEMMTPPLPAGVYVLAVNHKVFMPFQISDIAFVDWGTTGVVLNRTTGDALSGAVLDIFTADYDYISHLNRYERWGRTRQSDPDGFTDLSEPVMADESGTDRGRLNRFFLFRHGTDSLIRTYVHPPFAWRAAAGNGRTAEADTLAGIHFFLDLPVYRPGDSVRFKGVAWARKADTGLPFAVAGKILEISLEAPEPFGGHGYAGGRGWQNAGKQTVSLFTETDCTGGFTGGFLLPDAATAGLWRLRVRLVEPDRAARRREETGRFLFSKNAWQYFRVEAYRPSQFEIHLENRDSVIRGRAVALDGRALSGGTVRIDVRLENGGWPRMDATAETAWQAALSTDADGCFFLKTDWFAHLEDEADGETAHFGGGYRLDCTVTDLNGEVQTATLWLPLRRQAWQAVLQVPERRLNGMEDLNGTGGMAGMSDTAGATVDTFKLMIYNAALERRTADCRLSIDRLTDTLPDRAFDRRFPEPDLFPLPVDSFLRAFPDEPYYTQTARQDAAVRQTAYTYEGRDTAFTATLPDGRYAYRILIANPWIDGRTDSCEGTFNLGRQPLVPTLYTDLEDDSLHLCWVVPEQPSFAEPAWQSVRVFYSIENRRGQTRQGRLVVNADGTGLSQAASPAVQPKDDASPTLALSAFSPEDDLNILLAYICGGRLFQQNVYRAGITATPPLEIELNRLPDTARTRSSDTLGLHIRRGGKAVAAPLTLALYDDALHAFAPETWFAERPPRLVPPVAVTPFNRHFYGYDPIWFTQEHAYMKPTAYAHAERPGLRTAGTMATRPLSGVDRRMAKNEIADLSTEIGGGHPDVNPAPEVGSADGDQSRPTEWPPLRGEQPASVCFFPTLWSDTAGYLHLPFDLPAAPGRYRWVIAAYDRDFQAVYETRTLQAQQDYRLTWRPPQFLYAGDSVRFSAKAVRLDAAKPLTASVRWEIAGQHFESTLQWQAGETEKQLAAPVAYSPQDSGLLSVRLYLSVENPETRRTRHGETLEAPSGDALETQIPVLSDCIHLKEHIPFVVRPGEQITLNLPKNLCDALRRSPAIDTVFHWMPNPEQRIGLLCETLMLDTVTDAWNALLHYLKSSLSQTPANPRGSRTAKNAVTEAAFQRLCRFLTPDGGFCWLPGQPTDPTVSLAIAETLAANCIGSYDILTLLRRTLLPYLELTQTETPPADSLPSPMRLRYLYTASLVYGSSADRYTANYRHDLDAFAGNLDHYPIRTGIYGLYALQLYGDTTLATQIWRHYRRAARYGETTGLSWKANDMGLNLGESLKTASLVYRLLRLRNDWIDAAAVSHWIGRQNRTVDLLSPMAAVRPIDVLTLAYNERLFPLPTPPDRSKSAPPIWRLKGRKLFIDWRTAETADSVTALFGGYGALTFGYTQTLSAVTASPASDLNIELLPPETVRQGESPVLRLRITSKHPASYVRVRFGRPGGSEYGSTRAGLAYKNGLSFYEDIQSTHTDILIPFLPAGRYLLSYPLNATTIGRFALPPASIEILLDATDSFTAHSHAPSVRIEK